MQNWLTSALILIALFAGFIALVIWAWSKARQPDFTAASRLPLEDDEVLNKAASDVHPSSQNSSQEPRT